MSLGRLNRWRWMVLILVCCGCEARSLDPPPETTTPPTPSPAPHALDRVALAGASATKGFGAEVRFVNAEGKNRYASIELADVIDAAIARDHREVGGHGDAFFYTAPMRRGPKLLDRALAERPTLLLAIDFLFWFAYGINGPDGVPFASDDERVELLEEGLRLLEAVECPVLVGDLPDMSPAIGIMLGESQVPSVETLGVLNERIREWARDRPNVIVVPIAESIGRIQRDESVDIGEHHWPAGSASELVQYDHLHPTARGLIVTAQLAAQSIIDSGQAGADDFDLDPEAVLERMSERAMMGQ